MRWFAVLLMGSAVSRSLPAAPVAGAKWTITRLPSALDAATRTAQRRRPWLSASEEAVKQQERIARVRRENGIPSPDDWMW